MLSRSKIESNNAKPESQLPPRERMAAFNAQSPVKCESLEEYLEIERRVRAEEGGEGGLQDPSRRRFLKQAGAGALALALGGSALIKAVEYLTRQKEDGGGIKADPEAKPDGSKADGPEAEKENNLADLYLDAFSRLSRNSGMMPAEIFEKDLLIALQCQESRGQIDAVSHSGALGVMQNMDVSIVDVTRYLNKLKRNEDFVWSGPQKELSRAELAEIKRSISQSGDHGRAIGKIYMIQLWDEKNGYGVGRKAYRRGGAKAAQTELLGAYNAGLGRIKDKPFEEWPQLRDHYRHDRSESGQREFRAYNEAIDYVHKIFNYKERLGNIRGWIKEAAVVFDENEDYAVRRIALDLDYVTGSSGEARKQALRERAMKYIHEFKRINETKGRGPSYQEIDRIVLLKNIF